MQLAFLQRSVDKMACVCLFFPPLLRCKQYWNRRINITIHLLGFASDDIRSSLLRCMLLYARNCCSFSSFYNQMTIICKCFSLHFVQEQISEPVNSWDGLSLNLEMQSQYSCSLASLSESYQDLMCSRPVSSEHKRKEDREMCTHSFCISISPRN